MKDVAHQQQAQSSQRATMLQDRVTIKQRLGRMLMHAIASIEDGNPQMPGEHMRSP